MMESDYIVLVSRDVPSDRRLSEDAFYADATLLEHREYCDGCPTCGNAQRILDEVNATMAHRERIGLIVEDPDEPTLEERLGPYGIEWQIEQEERAGR